MQTSYLNSSTKHLNYKIPKDAPQLNASPRTKAIYVKECTHISPQLINIGSSGGEWPQVTLSKGCCTWEEKSLGSHRIEGWMGLSGGLGFL